MLVGLCQHSFYSSMAPGELCAVSPSSAVAPPALDDNDALPAKRSLPQSLIFDLNPSTSCLFSSFSTPECVCRTDVLWHEKLFSNKKTFPCKMSRFFLSTTFSVLVLSMLMDAATCSLSCFKLTFLSLLFSTLFRDYNNLASLFAHSHTHKGHMRLTLAHYLHRC